MPQTAQPDDQLTEYERAVCYYTLPGVSGSVTFGLVAVYTLCLLEAAAALAYGLSAGDADWTAAGTWCLGGMVLFGVVVFFVRALVRDLRKRYLLAAAHRTPAGPVADDLPDPFAGHVLLKKPLRPARELFAITGDAGHIHYYVEVRRPGKHWRMRRVADEPFVDVVVLQGVRSFAFFPRGAAEPGRLGVYEDNELITEIHCRFSWTQPDILILPKDPDAAGHIIRQDGVYQGERLVGRIYRLRGWCYIDIEADQLTEGVLAAFLAMA